MSKQSAAIPWSQLHLLPVDSHVRMSAPQGKGRESRKVHAVDYGQSFTESFANYDPDTSSWRTSQGCLLTGWAEFSETWPKSGTMRSGRCYRRQTLAHRTSEKGSSSWPTPRTADWKGATKPSPTTKRRVEEGIANLPEALQEHRRTWPTPRASEWKGTGPLGSKSHGHRLKKKYLDATVQEAEQITGQLNPTWVEWLMGFPSGWTDLRA